MSAEYYQPEESVVHVINKLASVDAMQVAAKYKQEVIFSREQHQASIKIDEAENINPLPQRIPTEDPFVKNQKSLRRLPRNARRGFRETDPSILERKVS